MHIIEAAFIFIFDNREKNYIHEFVRCSINKQLIETSTEFVFSLMRLSPPR